MRVGTPQVSHLSATMGDEERSPLLGPRITTLRHTGVPILEAEDSDGGGPRAPARAMAARLARRATRTSSVSSLRFSIRVAEPEPEPPGPDGGWGWVVCLAAFYCISVLDGQLEQVILNVVFRCFLHIRCFP